MHFFLHSFSPHQSLAACCVKPSMGLCCCLLLLLLLWPMLVENSRTPSKMPLMSLKTFSA